MDSMAVGGGWIDCGLFFSSNREIKFDFDVMFDGGPESVSSGERIDVAKLPAYLMKW